MIKEVAIIKNLNRFKEVRVQLIAYAILSGLIFCFFAAMSVLNRFPLEKYFGDYSPFAIIVFVIIVGAVLFVINVYNSDFRFILKTNRNYPEIFIFSCIFAAIIITVDIVKPFPKEINVLSLGGIIFYPSMAFVVEIIFHLLPVTILACTMKLFNKNLKNNLVLVVGLIMIAFLEPAYQSVLMGPDMFTIKSCIVFINILLINICGLYLFVRYDFLTMYGFRLIYYLLWHIIWGNLRYELLF